MAGTNPFVRAFATKAAPTAAAAPSAPTAQSNPFVAAFHSKTAAPAATPTSPTQAPSAASSALKWIGDRLDVPLAITESALADQTTPENTRPDTTPTSKNPIIGALEQFADARTAPHLRRTLEDLDSGGPEKVAENDVYFRKGSLDRTIADPQADAGSKAQAQWLEKHPKISAAGDFVSEFANPANPALGHVIAPIAGAAMKAAKATPYIGPAIEKASDGISALFDKYHPLKIAGGTAAKMLGRKADAAKGMMANENAKVAEQIFGNPGRTGLGGTTKAERYEILRRATGGEARPTPKGLGALPDAEIQRRADLFRKVTDEADATQRERGMLDQEHENYFNMRGAYELPETKVSTGSGRGGSGAGGALRYRAPTRAEKVYDTFDQVLDAHAAGHVKLADNFDPYNQLISHLNRVSTNVALDDFIKNLTSTDAAHELSITTPNGLTATGPEAIKTAHAAASPRARAYATAYATAEIAKRFGIDEADVQRIVARRFDNPDLLNAKLSELMRQGKVLPDIKRRVGNEGLDTAGRVQTSIKTLANRDTGAVGRAGAASETVPRATNRRIEQIENNAGQNAARVRASAERVQEAVGRVQESTMRRGIDLFQRSVDPERPIAQSYRAFRDKAFREAQSEQFQKELDRMTPEGYVRLKSIPGLSGLDRMEYTAVKPEVEKYLTDAGAPKPEANAVSAFMDRFNSLFRLSILTNPLIHPGYNLLWAYLGGGGNPLRLANIFRDSPLDHAAAEAGAHASLSGFAYGDNPSRLVQSFPDAAKQGVGAAADWAVSRMSELNRKLVFDTIERRMATEFWASLKAKGVEDGRAGELVRKAFGDYDNMTTAERSISRAFFFYPWTKAVIPFWLKALATRPQYTTAPMNAIRTKNELQGDPNVDKEAPFTDYTGNDEQGNPQYQTLPLPQRNIEAPLETVLPRTQGAVDTGAGLKERTMPLVSMAQHHLTPGLGAMAGAGEQLFKDPQEPGVTPGQNVDFDVDAPLGTQAKQMGEAAAQQDIPFAELAVGAAHAAGEVAHGDYMRAAQNLIGGYQYGEASPQVQKRLNALFEAFQRSYNRAKKNPDPEARRAKQTSDYEIFRAHADALIKSSQQRP